MLQLYFDYCQRIAFVLTAIAGVFGIGYLVGCAAIGCINIWGKVFRVSGALLDAWKQQQNRTEQNRTD